MVPLPLHCLFAFVSTGSLLLLKSKSLPSGKSVSVLFEMAQLRHKCKTEFNGSLWPKKKELSGINKIYAAEIDHWETVDLFEVRAIQYPFKVFQAHAVIILAHSSFEIHVKTASNSTLCLPYKGDQSSFSKAKLLREYVTQLKELPCRFVTLFSPEIIPPSFRKNGRAVNLP